jgi:hypothetical protein
MKMNMKMKFRQLYITVFCMLIAFSCIDEDKKLFDDFERGSIPLFTANDEDSGIIDLTALDQTVMSFTIDKQGLADVESIDVKLTFNNAETGESHDVILTNVASLPVSQTYSVDDFVNAFPPEIVTKDTLGIGDNFVVGGNMKMVDGRYLDGGYSPSIFANNPTSITYNVACSSNITEGVYIATQNDEAEWFGGASTKEVTITKVAGTVNQYLITDVSAGGYALCCLAFGYNADQPAVITDICNSITVTGTSTSQIESGQGLQEGSWDPATQTLVVHYADTFNGSGDAGLDLFSTFVKKP